MLTHYLQHVPFEGLGSIGPWLERAGHKVTGTRLYDSRALPHIDEFDLLIAMGGPMSVNDEDRFPWLAPEKQLIRHAIEQGKAVLGICLGAQLIAAAMGARVLRNREKEIGWFPVQGVPPSNRSAFCLPPSATVFHWHGETFELPAGATRIGRSDGCKNQGFQLGRSVIGLQFHLETTPASARDLITHCREELSPGRYVQSEADMLAVPVERYSAINNLMDEVLGYLCNRRG